MITSDRYLGGYVVRFVGYKRGRNGGQGDQGRRMVDRQKEEEDKIFHSALAVFMHSLQSQLVVSCSGCFERSTED